jgi:hypothetical protein
VLACALVVAAGYGFVTDRGPFAEHWTLSAPDVYYLRPYGDRHGMTDKPFLQVDLRGGPVRGGLGRRRVAAVVEPGSEDVVRLTEKGSDCRGSATRLTCTGIDDTLNYDGNVRLTPRAVKGSRVGQKGRVRFTYTLEDGKKVTARTTFVVGEPVLEVGRTGTVDGVRPGSVLSTPFVVRNTGERTVRGLGIRFGISQSEFAERYANCRYPGRYGRDAICDFPALRIAPGQSVVIRPRLKTQVSKTLMYMDLTEQAWPLDVGPGPYSAWMNGGDHGDGPTLKAELHIGTPHVPGVRSFAQGQAATSVGVALRSDYAVFATDLHGAPGDKRTLRLTVRNDGPGDPGDSSSLLFTPPPDVRVLKQPTELIDEDTYGPYCTYTDQAYRCRIGRLEPGHSRTFEFTLGLGAPGTGSVRVVDNDPYPSMPKDWLTRRGRQDPDPGNDETPVRVLG